MLLYHVYFYFVTSRARCLFSPPLKSDVSEDDEVEANETPKEEVAARTPSAEDRTAEGLGGGGSKKN